MICFNTAACIGSIDVECIEMGTYLLQRREVLSNTSLWYHSQDIKIELTVTEHTCDNAAPVSRTLLVVERASPRALFEVCSA